MANDLYLPGGGEPASSGMTVMELAIFLSIHRSRRSLRLDGVCTQLGHWFEDPQAIETVVEPVGRMVARGWLVADGDRLRPTNSGRETARPLLRGVVKMLDAGTTLLDLALMMSVLGFAANELDDADEGA